MNRARGGAATTSTNLVDAAAAGGDRRASGEPLAASLARGLGLAATPAFALMALWTQLHAEQDALCSATPGAVSPMTLMYLMMSAAHLAPWIRLVGAALSGD